MELHIILAGSNAAALRDAEAFLLKRSLKRITVVSQQSKVLSLLQQLTVEERRKTVVIAQVS